MLIQEATRSTICLFPEDWSKLKALFEITLSLVKVQTVSAHLWVNGEINLTLKHVDGQYYIYLQTHEECCVLAQDKSVRFTLEEWTDFINCSEWIDEYITCEHDMEEPYALRYQLWFKTKRKVDVELDWRARLTGPIYSAEEFLKLYENGKI